MYGNDFRAPKVDVHQFSMIPRAEIPRSSFRMMTQHKTTINASNLVPVFLQEVLPGDSFACSMTAFCRMATPLYPIMDNMELESFFFFVPNRLVWSHWQLFCGEQKNPGDSISYSVPQVSSPAGGYVAGSIYDYFGLPTAGQVGAGNTVSHSALPLRAYNLTYNEWFRDENLETALGFGATGGVGDFGDGPDPNTNYAIQDVAKRHDYFTSCLPWTQKGPAVGLPLSGNAPVTGIGFAQSGTQVVGPVSNVRESSGTVVNYAYGAQGAQLTAGQVTVLSAGPNLQSTGPQIFANLSAVTAATINQLRTAFQTQKLLERDARGGTRYTEIVRSHFGVMSPDARLQRPEYLGGGRTSVNISPVPQTTATGVSGSTSPLGTLAAVGTSVARSHGFRQAFTEHGHILGLVCIRADPVYQQGMRKLWSRLTRYDFYWPVFSALGEQAVLNQEIYMIGNTTQDGAVFGYIERWAEYRYFPSMVTGMFRSTNATPLDSWHLAEKFLALPTLSASFIVDKTRVTLQRNLAAGAQAAGEQFICDFLFDVRAARPMPMYSVPGMIDHF